MKQHVISGISSSFVDVSLQYSWEDHIAHETLEAVSPQPVGKLGKLWGNCVKCRSEHTLNRCVFHSSTNMIFKIKS